MGVSGFRISEILIIEEGGVPEDIYLVGTADQQMFGIFHFIAQVTATRFDVGQSSLLVQSEFVKCLVVEHPVPYVSGWVAHDVFIKCCPLFLSYILVVKVVATSIYVVHRFHSEADFFVGEVESRRLIKNECILKKWLEVGIVVFSVVVINECLVQEAIIIMSCWRSALLIFIHNILLRFW